MTTPDPRREVDAPVRRALTRIAAHGLLLVGAISALASLPIALPLDVPTRDALAVVTTAVLLAWAITVHVRRLARQPSSMADRGPAWDRAREVDVDDAMLARLIRAWVPIGLLLALGVLLWPHLTDANPALACAWAVLGLPPIAIAWLFASSTWLDASSEELIRATGEADRILRHYWANVGR